MRKPTNAGGLNLILAALLMTGAAGTAHAAKRHHPPPFKYDGGSENLPKSCQGSVQVGASALTYKCAEGSVSVPYSAIKLMQYRPDVSKKVRDLKVDWVVTPGSSIPLISGHRNRYFAIVYELHGAIRVIVLDVPPETMRPYLAEIDVKAGKRVEVEETEEYD